MTKKDEGRLIVCKLCGDDGGTLKSVEGGYVHLHGCDEAMKQKEKKMKAMYGNLALKSDYEIGPYLKEELKAEEKKEGGKENG